MRPIQHDIDLPDPDPNGIAEDQTTGGAGNLTLNGAVCDLGTAGQFDVGDYYDAVIDGVRLDFESAANLSAITFTITGTNAATGLADTEAVTGPNANTVTSTKYWSQVTQIAASAAVGSNIEVGVSDEVISIVIPLNWRDWEPATVAVLGLSGTVQFDVEETFEKMIEGRPTNFRTRLSNQSADFSNIMSVHATACRLKTDSYSSGAEFQFHLAQN